MAVVDRLRRQPRARQHRRHRHQRRAGRRDRPRDAARRERVRSDRRAACRRRRGTRRSCSSTRSRRASSARRSTPTSTRSRSELEKRMSNRWSGPRELHLRASATTSRAIIVDSNPRLDYGRCDRDNTHAFATSANVDLGNGLGARHGVPRVFGLSDQRDGRHRRQRRRHQQRPADEGRQRPRRCPIRSAARFARRRRPQRHRRRAEDAPRRAVPVHPADRPVSGRASSWRSTT